ncbi:adenosylcobinamide amidohydrolase [Bacillus seohaeanensis]|jgi:iron complex transport system ATP-binding protein|uniref:Adenosylcobinamide amidohydrolase n=1 Tax=Bacillus seohaeanensis TaxID=284580 RepID=A0ABW5RVF6_9BACI
MISVQQLTAGYENKKILKNISFTVQAGEFFGILGPNGSGKTTLLKVLSGLLPTDNGSVTIQGKDISFYSSKELAKTIAVLPQITSNSFSYRVKETVMLGRYAHQKGLFKGIQPEDEQVVEEVMKQIGVWELQDRVLDELSGGERQRVFLAQSLVQQPKILILDEPTNHLDLSFQKNLLDLLKHRSKQDNLTIISIFHDLNLASLYCDRLLLLHEGKEKLVDHPENVLSVKNIEEVYHTKVEKRPHPKVPKPQMVIIPEADEADLEDVILGEQYIGESDDYISYHSPIPLKSMSSGVIGSGLGWYQHFINRHVPKDYDISNYYEDMKQYLYDHGFDPSFTVGMMTAVILEDVTYKKFKLGDCSIFVVVTAGVGNAVDVSNSYQFDLEPSPGTINTWVFINGNLSDEAFIQAIVTATEAKVKAMRDLDILDPKTGTFATGTSTDSIMIAATQRGKKHTFAGSITSLGKLIGQGVHECTKEAIQKSVKRRSKL